MPNLIPKLDVMPLPLGSTITSQPKDSDNEPKDDNNEEPPPMIAKVQTVNSDNEDSDDED